MESKQAQMTVSASLIYGSAETLKSSTPWPWFSINLQSFSSDVLSAPSELHLQGIADTSGHI